MAREFDITDIAGLRRSPSTAGFRARQSAQNVAPFRPGAAPQRPSILSEMTQPVPAPRRAPARSEIAWLAAQANPNMGSLDPDVSTGSRSRDLELLHRARQQEGMASGRMAVEELKRHQWVTGERTLADELAGATAPSYAGTGAPERPMSPPDNGTWTAPDGTRYAMRNGVPVGRSGAATGGTWEMGAGQVGEFTGWGDTASRQNYLRDELLGKMGQTMGPPARRNVIPVQPPAPTPQVAQTPQAPPSTTPPAPPPPGSSVVKTSPGEPLPVSLVRDTFEKQGSEAAYVQALDAGLIPAPVKAVIDDRLKAVAQDTAQLTRQITDAAARGEQELTKLQEDLARGTSIIGTVSPVERPLSAEARKKIQDRILELNTLLKNRDAELMKVKEAAVKRSEEIRRKAVESLIKK